MKRKIIIWGSTIFTIILIIFTTVSINIKNSVEYASYELSIAHKYKDSARALKYHDIAKISDSFINELIDELYKEDDAMTIAIGSGMIANYKETLSRKVEKMLISEYESEPGKVKDINNIKILYLCLNGKPVTADKLKTEKLSKSKIKQAFCDNDEKYCYERIWEKEKSGWRVVGLKYPEN